MRDNAESEMKIARTLIIHESVFGNERSKACLHGVGEPLSSGVGFFCFHALGDTKQKKPTPENRGPPLHVNRV